MLPEKVTNVWIPLSINILKIFWAVYIFLFMLLWSVPWFEHRMRYIKKWMEDNPFFVTTIILIVTIIIIFYFKPGNPPELLKIPEVYREKEYWPAPMHYSFEQYLEIFRLYRINFRGLFIIGHEQNYKAWEINFLNNQSIIIDMHNILTKSEDPRIDTELGKSLSKLYRETINQHQGLTEDMFYHYRSLFGSGDNFIKFHEVFSDYRLGGLSNWNRVSFHKFMWIVNNDYPFSFIDPQKFEEAQNLIIQAQLRHEHKELILGSSIALILLFPITLTLNLALMDYFS